MQDKNKTSQVRELNKVTDLSTEFKDEVFPTRLRGRNTILSATVDSTVICYLCMDDGIGGTILHLYLPKEHRNKITISIMKEMFYTHVHPWCKEHGYKLIIVSCAGNDTKTTALFKTFGFNPENINLAVMPVK